MVTEVCEGTTALRCDVRMPHRSCSNQSNESILGTFHEKRSCGASLRGACGYIFCSCAKVVERAVTETSEARRTVKRTVWICAKVVERAVTEASEARRTVERTAWNLRSMQMWGVGQKIYRRRIYRVSR